MGWQDDVREILEKSDWPPKPGTMTKVPWMKVAMLAAAGWIVAELLTRAEEGAKTRTGRLAAHR